MQTVNGEKVRSLGDESMPDSSTDHAPPSFFDLFSRGEVSAEVIDVWVGRWHDGQDPASVGRELSDHLGLTVPEYQVWICDADALPFLLDARRAGRALDEVVRERLTAVTNAGCPEDRTVIRGLQAWLTMRTRAHPTAA
jgi:hypothetical protein